ncbi:DUF421 domain-containing protein [Salsuginibacillus kocurii]|uniref:DUF421 domain-containing protein n=1 Tax=Salsuginibacillus kocurii TaxID=427078 RepID=UPI0003757842|nr:DUF421 domain-containing protein [Salsuginibacillus kocurii]
MDLSLLVVRTVLIYVFLLLVLRIMGKREIGQLSLLDFVISIMIAELAVLALDESELPMWKAFFPIALLALIQYSSAFISLKSVFFRNAVDGIAILLIENGKVNEQNMRRERYNFDDLLLQLRQQGITAIDDIKYGILEPSGELSVIKKGDGVHSKTFPFALIMDGKVQSRHLEMLGVTETWLQRELSKKDIEQDKVSLCMYQDGGELYIDLKDN